MNFVPEQLNTQQNKSEVPRFKVSLSSLFSHQNLRIYEFSHNNNDTLIKEDNLSYDTLGRFV